MTRSRDAVPWQGSVTCPAAPRGLGATTPDGDASESSVGIYSHPVDSSGKRHIFHLILQCFEVVFLLDE